MIELKKHYIYTLKELCEWMGLKSYKSFLRTKEKKLEILKVFCDYELTDGEKIFITQVYIPVYNKEVYSNKKKVEIAMRDLWGQGNGKYGYDTYINCARKIEQQKDKYKITTRESTNARYCSLTRQENKKLTIQNIKYVKEVREADGSISYHDFTEQEREIKVKVWNKVFGNISNIEWEEKRRAYEKAYSRREISKEEYGEKLIEIEEERSTILEPCWTTYLEMLATELNCSIKRATEIAESVF